MKLILKVIVFACLNIFIFEAFVMFCFCKPNDCIESINLQTISQKEYVIDKEIIKFTAEVFSHNEYLSSFGFLTRLKDTSKTRIEVDTIVYSPDKLKFVSLLCIEYYDIKKGYSFNSTKSEFETATKDTGYFYNPIVFIGIRDSLNQLWYIYQTALTPVIFGYKDKNKAIRETRDTYFENLHNCINYSDRAIDKYKDLFIEKSISMYKYKIGYNLSQSCFWNSIVFEKGKDHRGGASKFYDQFYEFQLQCNTNNPERSVHYDTSLKKIMYPDSLIDQYFSIIR